MRRTARMADAAGRVPTNGGVGTPFRVVDGEIGIAPGRVAAVHEFTVH